MCRHRCPERGGACLSVHRGEAAGQRGQSWVGRGGEEEGARLLSPWNVNGMRERGYLI